MNVKGKTALVFGGSSGIGLTTAGRLAAAGAKVSVVSRNPDRARDALPEGVELIAGDTRDGAAVAAICKQMAPIDILINSATGGERAIGPFLEMDMDGYKGSFDKLWGYANTVRYGAEHLAPNGSIVLVTGTPAKRGKPGQTALSSVGGAIEAFVRTLAVEIAPRRINAVSPGVTDTPMFGAASEQKSAMLQKATAKHLLNRAVQPDEITDAIMLVATNEMMTGQAIDVDGGWLLSG